MGIVKPCVSEVICNTSLGEQCPGYKASAGAFSFATVALFTMQDLQVCSIWRGDIVL